jgi:hypothetical protein
MADVLYVHPSSVRYVVLDVDEVSHLFYLERRAQAKTCYSKQSGEQNYALEVIQGVSPL